MKPDEILNYHPERKAVTVKVRALRLLAGFMAVMLLCTLLSRAADSLTMPQVTVEKPTRSAITHTVRADGVLKAGKETMITVAAGILVDSIEAGEGQPVEAEDVIFTLNDKSLSKRIREENTALQKLRLEFSAQQLSGQLGEKKNQLAYQRASQDYSDAFDRSYKAYDDARTARGEALNAMRNYYAKHKEVIDRWNGSIPIGASSLEEQEIVAHYRRLQSEYDAADTVYEAGRDSRRDAWKNAERQLEDAQLALDWDTDKQAEIMELLLAMQEEKTKELERLSQDGGAVRTPIDGVVTRVMVKVGSATDESAAAMVAQKEGGYRFVAEVTEDDMKYIDHGASGTVAIRDGRPLKVTLDNIHDKTITTLLPEGTGELGGRGVIEISQKSDNYNTCVPMSALRSDGSRKYVMVLRESETVLGTQLVAERVDVQVEDNNETRAAVSGALLDSDRVIVSSTKAVRAGDRVRLLMP
ncbi:MAG: hypothetical protein RSD74_05815 [Angelakisella sp.]